MRTRWIDVVVWLVVVVAFPLDALAQGAAPVQDIETSVRAAGMGGATTAVGWGEPGVWGNPAALAGVQGVAWLEGRTRLHPEASSGDRFDSRRFLIGGAGLGVSLMGEPLDGLGSARFQRRSQGTDPFGNPTGSFDGEDKVEAWGVGIAPLRLLATIPGVPLTRAGALERIVDIGVGYQHKRTHVELGPAFPAAEASNFDWGVYARIAPIAGKPDNRTTRVELCFAFADLNGDRSSQFVIPGVENLGPSTRIRRTAVATHILLPLAGNSDGASPWSWWMASVPSAFGLGFAYDLEERSGRGSTDYVDHWGAEVSFMETLVARVGYVDDQEGDVHNLSAGLGLHVPIGPWATVGYDWASAPQGAGLKNQNRHGWSTWIHPEVIWKSLRTNS